MVNYATGDPSASKSVATDLLSKHERHEFRPEGTCPKTSIVNDVSLTKDERHQFRQIAEYQDHPVTPRRQTAPHDRRLRERPP